MSNSSPACKYSYATDLRRQAAVTSRQPAAPPDQPAAKCHPPANPDTRAAAKSPAKADPEAHPAGQSARSAAE
ncbi:MAG: hypothetical protein O3C40_26515 [Planctomycetota bacterium]|nr:hypothetical protein [Planctomycetota bacterium]